MQNQESCHGRDERWVPSVLEGPGYGCGDLQCPRGDGAAVEDDALIAEGEAEETFLRDVGVLGMLFCGFA